MLPDIQVQFGKSVRRLGKKRGLSQEKLAELAGLRATYIGRVERGRQSIGLANIGRIARALRVRPAKLMDTLR